MLRHAADPVAEPAESQSTHRRPEQPRGGDVSHPGADVVTAQLVDPDRNDLKPLDVMGLGRMKDHLLERRAGDEGKDSLFQSIEHPAEERREQYEPGGGIDWATKSRRRGFVRRRRRGVSHESTVTDSADNFECSYDVWRRFILSGEVCVLAHRFD